MKKTLILILTLMVGSFSLALADTDTNTSSDGAWVIQLNGDTAFPTGNLAGGVNQGWGGEGAIGYRFPSDFMVSIESGFDTYSPKNGTFTGTWDIVPLIVKGQFCMGTGSVKPYLFLGAGLAFNSIMASGIATNSSQTDFLGEGGVGIDFAVAEKVSLFVQGKVELDATTAAYSGDNPTWLIPVNAGIKFALN